MTKSSIDFSSCSNFDQNLPQLKQASSHLEYRYPQGQQENTNAEDYSSQNLFPESLCKPRFCCDNASAQVFGFTGCPIHRRCIQESDNIETGEYKPIRTPNAERLKLLSVSPLQLINPSSNPDTNPNFTDFELFDHQSDDYENHHDIWLSSSISDGNLDVDIENCRTFDKFNTPRSSVVSLSQSFCFPPLNSPTDSWSMGNQSMVSLPTMYQADFLEALNYNALSGVGQWTSGMTIGSNDLATAVESELQLSRSTNSNIVYVSNPSIVEAISSFELSFYDV
ncbi:hypothetical protein EYC80_006916 [Monilinia laxa]|uniref:Uncharacterized protein n=1 Tax=Monilinia laxa TaxID=61186 RepID=A0A5N6JZL2_MONLA|nr:hypothetical protein EYC80_006916 [Monilinia laxa]